jgi:hypothetical protein
MEGRLAKFIAFTVVSLLADSLAVLLLIQALTFKANMFLGIPFEIPIIINKNNPSPLIHR